MVAGAALTLRSYPSTVSRCALLFRRENPANPTGRALHFHQDPTSLTEHYNYDVQEAPSNCQSIRCQVRRTSFCGTGTVNSLNAHLHSSHPSVTYRKLYPNQCTAFYPTLFPFNSRLTHIAKALYPKIKN